MRLDAWSEHDSDGTAIWQYAERYLGGGTRSYSPFAADVDISTEYHPQLGAAAFTVPTFRIPPGLGGFLVSRHPSPLAALYRDGADLLLPVHPNALDSDDLVLRRELLDCERGPQLRVVPSANARTVFVLEIDGAPVDSHFVKLHYPRRLSRFTRRLRKPVIELQLWASDELIDADVPILPEVAGGYIGEGEDAWGFLIRDAVPVGAQRLPVTVPLFALYGEDVRSPGDPSLLRQLVAASGEDAGSFVADRIVAAAVRLWVRAVTRTGVAVEPHGQNTLLSFRLDGSATELLYRDCGVYVDESIRLGLGLSGLPPTNVIGRDVSADPRQILSLGYDSFLGHHALSYLARAAEEQLGVPPMRLRAAAREALALTAEFLPPTRYYYEAQLVDRNVVKLVDTGEVPHWR
ncbi:IucA/IucC family C-terminal-domain containing protein [Dactylosporangium siamense]|uniref:Aerobactin siderophore biosynthesis IucA/IucC-like C-terminal domain-containing protein n=1 Tax=Dactylosporangium siamense TaxID=685454 RepID=A0A919UAN3_9ACTN|nr:IucA/IucC family C-terminal-domain containing protein [Dactylosporangium siamense]GIG48699.1 hypothetical protein Dsi01nite_067400 [Dactylosporangium siamense]